MQRRAQVTNQPQVHRDLMLGINQVANLLAPTLGPMGGHVAGSANDNTRFEMWDDAGTTVRRLLELGTPQEDIGAMLMRSMIYRLEQRIGDGGSTAAVLTREITAQGVRLITAGINAMDVAKGLRAGREAAVAALRAQAMPAGDEDLLSRVAYSACHDAPLAALLGEIRSLLGAEGYVSIEKYVAPYLERRYVNGAHFAAKITSMHFYSDSVRRTATLAAPAVAVLDEGLSQQQDAVALLEAALRMDAKSLLIVAQDVTGAALNLLVANNTQPADKRKVAIVAVKLSAASTERADQLRDLCALTGATLLGRLQQTGTGNATPDHFGSATRVEWANNGLSVITPDSQRAEVREEADRVRERLATLDFDDKDRPALARRLGVLTGGIAELKIGAYSTFGRDALFGVATRTLRLLSAAQRGGVIAGGGAGYIHATASLTRANPALQELSDDSFAAVTMLSNALSAPLATIARNAGNENPRAVVFRVGERGAPYAWDAYSQQVVESTSAGVLDATEVAETVLASAISCALMALTTDVIVYHRKPKQNVKI